MRNLFTFCACIIFAVSSLGYAQSPRRTFGSQEPEIQEGTSPRPDFGIPRLGASKSPPPPPPPPSKVITTPARSDVKREPAPRPTRSETTRRNSEDGFLESILNADEKIPSGEEGDEKLSNLPSSRRMPPDSVNYQTQTLPDLIYKKSYSKENRHLPKSLTHGDFQQLLFNAIVRGEIDSVRSLLARDDVSLEFRNEQGDTPLIYAARSGQSELALPLLARHSDPNAQNDYGQTALHFASFGGDAGLVSALLRMGANPNLADVAGVVPLMLAIQAQHKEIAAMLLNMKANTNYVNAAGHTALHLAALNNQADEVRWLAYNGAQLNIQDPSGLTPLMIAAVKGNETIVTTLLQAGADISLRNNAGYNAFDLARRFGHPKIASMIYGVEMRARMMRPPLAPEIQQPSLSQLPEAVPGTETGGSDAEPVYAKPVPQPRQKPGMAAESDTSPPASGAPSDQKKSIPLVKAEPGPAIIAPPRRDTVSRSSSVPRPIMPLQPQQPVPSQQVPQAQLSPPQPIMPQTGGASSGRYDNYVRELDRSRIQRQWQ